MKINQARKIVEKEGICWSNYFDLNFIESNIILEGHEKVIEAIKRLKQFILTGK